MFEGISTRYLTGSLIRVGEVGEFAADLTIWGTGYDFGDRVLLGSVLRAVTYGLSPRGGGQVTF